MALPNILYVHSHDTGRYIQPYGYAVPTPRLQGLAEEGVLFRQCFCAGPTCSPSRAALLTGQCAHSAGMLGLAHRGSRLNDYGQHLVHTLRGAGYHSTLIGIQHITTNPQVIGYDRIVDTPSKSIADVAPAAVEFLNTRPQEPFFLSVGTIETHRLGQDVEGQFHRGELTEDPRYCRPPSPIPDTPETRLDMASFNTSARALDSGIGKVLDALETNGYADNTLVIYTTDHGPAFPEMKCHLTHHGTGVALIMRGPGEFSGGQVIDALISHVDVFPTLCEVLGVPGPAWLQGKSFLPVLRGEQQETNDQIYTEVNYHGHYQPKRSVRTARYSYIRIYPSDVDASMCCDWGASKALWLRHGWADRPIVAEQLYDLVFDPNERHNLADDPAVHGVLADLRGRLDRWMQATDDPLLTGTMDRSYRERVTS